MESPAYLFDQFARSRGLSKEAAKTGLMLQAYAAEGVGITDCVKKLHIAKSTAQRIARKLMIDFVDYRPYANLEKKGEPRPEPFFRPDRPAEELPLFRVA
ncbi:MAG: hypothetical protein J7500_15670 [Sphingomonas sp.]|uniref:hypothetical protein n=1 Tax=Sphingomonas sp. TaxID=28214 RepID=UPI001B23470D|nr:hypothetical protein [Sphingomonas sp.]MBO9624146.1 hypothetical protein [Sphingomonas sp.]